MGLVRRASRPQRVAKIAMPLARPPRLETLEREARKRVEEILAKQAKVLGIQVEELTRRLGVGRLELLLDQIDWEKDWEAPLRRELAGLTRDVIVRVGVPELERLGVESRMSFRLLNPRALQHAQSYVPDLVKEVTRTTQETIRDRMAAGFAEGKTTRQIGQQLRDVVGLTSRQASAVDALHAEGKEKAAEKLHARLLRERAKTIADTETIRAYNTGQQTAWETAAGEGLIDTDEAKRFWSVAASRQVGGRACDICSQIASMNNEGVALNEPFVMPDGTSLLHPPAHPRCRCGVKMRFT